jgi:hypothetical protein
MDIVDPTDKTVDALMKLELPAGVDVQIKLNWARPQWAPAGAICGRRFRHPWRRCTNDLRMAIMPGFSAARRVF